MTTSKNKIAIKSLHEGFLTISIPDGWDDVKGLVNKILEVEGRSFAFRGWNSDTLEAYFKATTNFATVK